MKNFKIFIVLIFLIIASACNKISTDENVYNYKTDYVGDNSKVTKIVDSVKLPSIVKRGDIKIDSDSEPYGVIIYLENTEDINPRDLSTNAAVYFSLISNLGYVEFKETSEKTIVVFNREEIDKFLESKYFKTSKEIGSNEKSFYDYIEKSRTELAY